MLQRIGLAQSMVHDPQLVILDEPTAGVDPLGSAAIAEIVRELKRRGKTVLLSSHLLAQIEGLCDRVAILHRGKLVCGGRIGDLAEEKDAESFVVQGLTSEGRAAVETEIKAQGGRLARVEKPRLSLDAYFLKEVHERENEYASKQEGGEEVANIIDSLTRIRLIAGTTFLEAVRQKFFNSLLLISIALVGSSTFFSSSISAQVS